MYPLDLASWCRDSLNGYCRRRRCSDRHLPNKGINLFDSHCHLDILLAVHQVRLPLCCKPKCFQGCISVFCHPSRYRLFPDVMAQDNVWAAVGLHPKCADQFESAKPHMMALLENPKVLALGECGLDYSVKFPSRNEQRQVFTSLCRLAVGLGKPLVVHTRCKDAMRHCFTIMEREIPREHPPFTCIAFRRVGSLPSLSMIISLIYILELQVW